MHKITENSDFDEVDGALKSILEQKNGNEMLLNEKECKSVHLRHLGKADRTKKKKNKASAYAKLKSIR
jgi:hypothetical protein